MSNYSYEVQEATSFLDMDKFILCGGVKQIQDAARTEKWCGYGWRNDLFEAKNAYDVAKIFGIELCDEGVGFYRPVIENTYVSNFFETMIEVVAPYMTDGIIKVDDEYNIVTIKFEDGKATVWRE